MSQSTQHQELTIKLLPAEVDTVITGLNVAAGSIVAFAIETRQEESASQEIMRVKKKILEQGLEVSE